MISVNKFHAVTIPDGTSTQRIHWPRGAGPKIPANQAFCSNSARVANQKNVAGYQAAPVTNARHMTVTPMETVTRIKICSWIWKEKRLSVPTPFWYKMPPTLFQKLFKKGNAFSSPPPRCSKEDPAFRYLCACVCVSGLCVTFYVGYPSVIYDFRYVVWKRVRVLVGVYVLNSTRHFPNQRCVVLLI